jgi:hypothetical protein
MTDNVTLNPGASGASVRAINRSGVATQVLAVDLGGEAGPEALLTAGQKTMANSVPVALASDQLAEPAGAAISGVSMPTGGVGLTGWLSSIYNAAQNLISAVNAAALTTPLPITISGSTGTDASANKPTLPNVGASPFGGTTLYSAYVLVATLAANASRNSWGFQNCSGARCVLLLHDGTASSGSAPNNATCYAIEGGAAPGFQGGSDGDAYFKGAVEVYAAAALTGSAYVALYQR